jgi:hypothetical protein
VLVRSCLWGVWVSSLGVLWVHIRVGFAGCVVHMLVVGYCVGCIVYVLGNGASGCSWSGLHTPVCRYCRLVCIFRFYCSMMYY